MATRKATPEELEELQKSMMAWGGSAWGLGAHRPRLRRLCQEERQDGGEGKACKN